MHSSSLVVLLAFVASGSSTGGARADETPERAAAAAKPAEERGIKKVVSRAELPGGLVLTVQPGRVAVSRGPLEAPLSVLGRSIEPRALKDVAMESGTSNLIATIEDSCDQDHAVPLTLPNLNARLENVAALALYRQRKWSAAADGFARALALDPGFDVAATNLASAQLRAGKRDAAARALAPLLARAPVATYARAASDPDLAPLLVRPELLALRAPARGTSRLALGRHDVALGGEGPGTAPGAFAVSDEHRLIAAVDDEWSWGTCVGQAALVLIDFTGAEVARLPLFSPSEMTADDAHDCPFVRPARPKIAARVAAAQRLLTDLGFSPAAGEEGAISTTEHGAARALFPRAKLGVVVGRDRVRALRGDEELGSAPTPGAQNLLTAAHLPDAHVVVVRWGRAGREGCERSDPQGVLVIPLRP